MSPVPFVQYFLLSLLATRSFCNACVKSYNELVRMTTISPERTETSFHLSKWQWLCHLWCHALMGIGLLWLPQSCTNETLTWDCKVCHMSVRTYTWSTKLNLGSDTEVEMKHLLVLDGIIMYEVTIKAIRCILCSLWNSLKNRYFRMIHEPFCVGQYVFFTPTCQFLCLYI